jgi:hypothetical protein
MNDRNGGVFAVKDRPLSFWAVVKNFGNQPEAEYKSYFKVQRTTGPALFNDSTTAAALNPGETESLALASTWRPATNGVYLIKVFTKLTGDMVPVNDTATLELRVLTLPGVLTFDGTQSDGVSWGDRGGLGSRFVPPVYPCSISAISQHVTAASGTRDVLLAIYDDDGPAEGPGTILFGDTVVATTAGGWDSVDLATPVVIADGAFFVGGIGDSVSFGVDLTLPVSYQEWENVGGVWSPGRFATVHDACVKATISGPVGIAEWVNPTPAPAPARIDVSPNPFAGVTNIRLLNPTGLEKTVELYNATGSIVRMVELSRGQATLDGRLLADGVYFARVTGTELPVAKVIVTR